ncbi:MAG: glutathione peroxidase [Saprospiraceae bacterium]|nr:glutathione peroxidase [Saprospiraceae bacterium]
MKLPILILTMTTLFMADTATTSIHDFKIQALNSEEMIDFSEFKGKKILVVNVASKCGFTKQYKDLEKLYSMYNDKLVIVGFPCNQFLGQEPGSEEKIAEFCSSTYGVSFPMTTKIKVKGNDQHPIYNFLTSKDQNGLDDYTVSWNFNKFMLDEEGKLLEYYPSKTLPLSSKITKHLRS